MYDMGELFRFGNVIVRIWSNDHNPPHVEVFWPSMKQSEAHAKFLLSTLECFECDGFSAKDIKRIQQELKKRHEKIWDAWRSIHENDE
jgi:hypothetical protein